jgi:hypothetical protein
VARWKLFDVGQSFFEPPGAIHLVSANASNTDWAELIAVFVADEGAQLTIPYRALRRRRPEADVRALVKITPRGSS